MLEARDLTGSNEPLSNTEPGVNEPSKWGRPDVKRMLVGTALGRMAMSVRSSLQLLATMYSKPELLGMRVNDQMAGTLVTKLCQKDKTFVDVGAHIGSVVSEVMRNCPSASLIAVEPVPEKVEHLRRKFPSVRVHGCALGEADGVASFFVHHKQSGYSSLGRPSEKSKADTTEIRMQIKRLDDLVSPDGVDVMKIDVEGAELGVLRGGEKLIATSRPTIMFESGPVIDDGLGYTKEAMWEWLAERNYAVLVPNRVAHSDPGLGRDGFLESHIHPRRTTNYFAVAAERRGEIRERTREILKIRKDS